MESRNDSLKLRTAFSLVSLSRTVRQCPKPSPGASHSCSRFLTVSTCCVPSFFVSAMFSLVRIPARSSSAVSSSSVAAGRSPIPSSVSTLEHTTARTARVDACDPATIVRVGRWTAEEKGEETERYGRGMVVRPGCRRTRHPFRSSTISGGGAAGCGGRSGGGAETADRYAALGSVIPGFWRGARGVGVGACRGLDGFESSLTALIDGCGGISGS